VDAAFLRRGERHRFLDLAQARAAPVAILHCRAPQSVLRERVAARAAARTDASEAGLDVLARQPAWWEPFDTREQLDVLEVDTSVATSVTAAVERLSALAGR
jgi:predicted kinase